MWIVFLIIAFFLILLLVAVHMVMGRKQQEQELLDDPQIHRSGIYSIVRKSPREKIADVKPSFEQLRQYLDDQNEDIRRRVIAGGDKERLLSTWEESLEACIQTIEDGDRDGTEFYYFDFEGDDPVCDGLVSKGNFVTREEIYRFPQVIPPFHLGCRCRVRPHQGTSKNLRETTRTDMRPFFSDDTLPPIPDWKRILKWW